MLTPRGTCMKHRDTSDIVIKVDFMNSEDMNPSAVKDFINTINKDIRVIKEGGEKEITIALSEMELIILDETDDPVHKLEYEGDNEIKDKTRKSLNWVYSNL